jgi:hypothetical protein
VEFLVIVACEDAEDLDSNVGDLFTVGLNHFETPTRSTINGDLTYRLTRSMKER